MGTAADHEMTAWMVEGGPAIRKVFRTSSNLGFLIATDVIAVTDDCDRLAAAAKALRETLPSPDPELNAAIRAMAGSYIAADAEPPCHVTVRMEGGQITHIETSPKRFNKLWARATQHADRVRARLTALGF